MSEHEFEVVWPSSRHRSSEIGDVEGLGELDGKRIAFLWDYIFKGDEMFEIIEESLEKQFPGVEIVGYDEFGNFRGPNELETFKTLPGKLIEMGVDGAVIGVGS